MKTHVVKNNCNPEWDENLTLSIKDVKTPIHLNVYDKDTFSGDDRMGEADIDLKPYVECLQMELNKLIQQRNGFSIKRIQPDETNCLAEESNCIWQDGNIIQEMVLRLKNVETGELYVEIEWIDVIGCKGLSQVEL
ncbi:protein C2-DOMAIN ABA-RELATED 9 isoform X2 [Cajanus cajan]|nr:protein C2-DOMAIN ABA-RELATED 9 isoform X2 [Cajanus cajan]